MNDDAGVAAGGAIPASTVKQLLEVTRLLAVTSDLDQLLLRIAQAVTEGVAFAEALRLPLDKVLEVVGSGAAGSWFMTHRGKNFIAGEYPLGFKLALHLKDLYICRTMAHALGGKLPLTEATIPQYEQLRQQGHGDEDISTLYRANRHLFPKRAA